MYLSKLPIPRYTGKDYVILVFSMFPLTILMNIFLFGSRYFSEPLVLLAGTLVTFIILASSFILFNTIAVLLRNRLPENEDNPKRLGLTIIFSLLLSYVILSLMFRTYDLANFLSYEFNEGNFAKAFVSMVIVNVFLTFLNEGVSRFENYRATQTETEALKKEYTQSQLLGLKSQVNPHFLFNSLNSLSSLINEEPEKAESFLDEMSKVYRYLLRNNEDYLVTLETELAFIKSYYHLLSARYGEALSLHVEPYTNAGNVMIPPLTLQIIIENIMNRNKISKEHPLRIEFSFSDDKISIRNNVQVKMNTDDAEEKIALENISNKFRLICKQCVCIDNENNHRRIDLPLVKKEEACLV